MGNMEQYFSEVYNKFKLMLYDKALKEQDGDRPDNLSLQEVIYMEIIIALGDPTISEFSKFAKLSAPNTAYRLRKLEEKGFIVRTQSARDKREFRVQATALYREQYGVIFDYISTVCDRINGRFTPEESALFEKMLGIISNELMPEAGEHLRERE